MKNQAIVAKMINHNITGNSFIDKPLDEYIYASLSQPPIKIIDKCDSDDELDYIIECPNCGSHVNYGEHIYMLSGYIYCDTKDCRERLLIRNPYLGVKYKILLKGVDIIPTYYDEEYYWWSITIDMGEIEYLKIKPMQEIESRDNNE